MTQRNCLLAVLCLVLTSALSLAAAPPARPESLTSAQFGAIVETENQPAHLAVRQVHATYQSEREKQWEATKTADDITSGATFLGWIGALTTILIVAAI